MRWVLYIAPRARACLCLHTNMRVEWIGNMCAVQRERKQRECAPRPAEHKERAMCPSPHIWCAGAGSGLGRRSDQPNEISQHTKCLSGPIRIPSCLPWVYLIEGKLTGSKRSKAPFGLAHYFLGLAWAGLSGDGMGGTGPAKLCTEAPTDHVLLPSSHYHCFPSLSVPYLSWDPVPSALLHTFFISFCIFLIPSSSSFTFFSLSPHFFASSQDLGNS